MKYISLKEAASMSGYSADYIGQLIRSGKLEGKQVFSNISWMTTEDAIRAYLEKDKKITPKESYLYRTKEYFSSSDGLNTIYIAVSWVAIVLFVTFLVVLIGMIAISIDHRLEKKALEKAQYVH